MFIEFRYKVGKFVERYFGSEWKGGVVGVLNWELV